MMCYRVDLGCVTLSVLSRKIFVSCSFIVTVAKGLTSSLPVTTEYVRDVFAKCLVNQLIGAPAEEDEKMINSCVSCGKSWNI